MFNLGSDDKDELQENMKEIKNLIDKGSSEDQKQQDLGLDDKGFGGNRQNDNSTQFEQNTQQEQSGQQQQGNTSSGLGEGESGFDQNMSDDTQHNFPGEENQNAGNSMQDSQPGNNMQSRGNGLGGGQSTQQPSGDKLINEDEDNTESSPAEPEESIERSEDEPLFLREEQFNDVREMVEEMHYLTQEMGQKVDRMKKTVRNERDISKDSEDLVQAFSQRRSKVKSTINSGQN